MQTWDLIHDWHLVLPPSRPSAWQLAWISKIVESVDRKAPVAILGSTPELRDLCHELGFENIYILDKNRFFFDSMTKLMVHSNNENFIEGDWLNTIEKYPNFFHFILSDLTSGNLPYDTRATFYNLIEQSLVFDGFFCDKVLTHPDDLIPIQTLFEKYALLPLNLLHVNHFSCEMLFCSELLDIHELVDSTFFYSYLDDVVTNQRVRAFAHYASKITPYGCKWYYGKRWKYLEKNYCPNLTTISYYDDEIDSPYYKRLKYYAFQKR